MRDLIWKSMLSAQMSACYWNHLARRYSDREKWIKIFLAATSSATVASWSLDPNFGALWKILSGVSALVAVALPILDYPGQVGKMAKLMGKSAQLRNGYDQLWAQVDVLPDTSLNEAVNRLKAQEIEVSELEVGLPEDADLLMQSWNEVLESRGLKDSDGR
jgi:hypothetical protein